MVHGHGCSMKKWIALSAALAAMWWAAPAAAQTATPAIDNPFQIPDARSVLPTATDSKGVSSTLRILVLMTVLGLVPSILIMTTSFARVMIVLALLRQAMATPQLPPGQVLMAISLFVTILVMTPTWQLINAEAVEPYMEGQMSQRQAMDIAADHMKGFMYRQIDQSGNHEDIHLFLEYQRGKALSDEELANLTVNDVPLMTMIPAFMISELKTAFVMGFRIYLPFLVIDMVIASILISMGMMMLPPVLISLPFKILLFVLANGWHLIIQTLLYSFV